MRRRRRLGTTPDYSPTEEGPFVLQNYLEEELGYPPAGARFVVTSDSRLEIDFSPFNHEHVEYVAEVVTLLDEPYQKNG